jgi:hypothetical protein
MASANRQALFSFGNIEKSAQPLDLTLNGAVRALLHAPIGLEHLLPEGGQRCAAAFSATLARGHQRPGEVPIHGFDQVPGALVAHPHSPPGGGDRARLLYALQQVRLARADSYVGREDDSQPRAEGLVADRHGLNHERYLDACFPSGRVQYPRVQASAPRALSSDLALTAILGGRINRQRRIPAWRQKAFTEIDGCAPSEAFAASFEPLVRLHAAGAVQIG